MLEFAILPILLTGLVLFALIDDGSEDDIDEPLIDNKDGDVAGASGGADLMQVTDETPDETSDHPLIGTNGADIANLSNEADLYEGLQGDDSIAGNDGNDFLVSGGGDDAVSGDARNDEVGGDSGNDVVAGGDGDDALYGGGDDTITTSNFDASETNTVTLGGGDDVVIATANTVVTDFNPAVDKIDMGQLFEVDPAAGGTVPPAGTVVIDIDDVTDADGPATLVTFRDADTSAATNNAGLSIRLNGVAPSQLSDANFTTFTDNAANYS